MVLNQDMELVTKFNEACEKLKASGADLSRIKIVMERGASKTYITKRIMEEMGCQHD